uniref:Derlin n=1 Tax=Polytomella parva TaxID=51329 RepID=A0A7S0Y8K7_9CHLO|mmetsp:Transcript_14103/g.24723  ORF Transcript_14103/g.24723 Transcript_14103/m.24723 type:complete len:228 (+) Transcript_14103:147-830(+)
MAIEEWYKQLPIVTRTYVTLASLVTVGIALDLISEYNIYFYAPLIYEEHEYWRFFTNFLFFGKLGPDFLFHMFFLIKYSKSLEEESFRGRSADFLWMLTLGALLLTAMAHVAPVQFLGSSLTFMMVYVWSRRHRYVSLSFLGVFTFTAPYLPWVLLAFGAVVGSSPVSDILGLITGHLYYYLEDVYPVLSGRRPIKTPKIFEALIPGERFRIQREVAAGGRREGEGH